MRKIALSILFAGALAAGYAQAPTVLTLDQCRELAVENNAGVKIAAGKAEQAEQERKSLFTDYFPVISAQGLAYKSNKGILQYDVLDIFRIELLKKGWSGSVTALQPIFMGGRIVNGNKLAQVGVQAGKLQKENAVDMALLTVESYYWDLETLKAKRRTLLSVIEMVDTLQRQVQVAVDAGVVNMNDLLKVKLQRNNFLADMVDLDNGIQLSRNLLAQYIGMDGQSVDIPDDEIAEMPQYPSDLYIEAGQALPGTADYQLLEAEVKAAELRHRLTVGENLPTVAAGVGFFLDKTFGQRQNFFAGMITVQVPLSGWWSGSYKLKKAKIEIENAREQQTDLSQMLMLKMQDTWDNLTAAYRKMQIAQESIAQSKENLRLNQNYYDAGISTITDLLDAQTLYRQSLDQYTAAYGAYCKCKAQYLNATGRSSL